MPADHVNIQPPQSFEIEGDRYRTRLEIDKLILELKQMRLFYDALRGNLEAIFTRIGRGDPAELHYDDGSVFVITGVKRNDT